MDRYPLNPYDRPPTNAELEAMIWQAARPDRPATPDQRALLYLALVLLRRPQGET